MLKPLVSRRSHVNKHSVRFTAADIFVSLFIASVQTSMNAKAVIYLSKNGFSQRYPHPPQTHTHTQQQQQHQNTISNLSSTNSKQATKQALQTNLQSTPSIERRGKFTYLLESEICTGCLEVVHSILSVITVHNNVTVVVKSD